MTAGKHVPTTDTAGDASVEEPAPGGDVQTGPRQERLGGYVSAWFARVKSGESGALPVVVGLIVIIIIFQSKDSVFLSAGNIINLMVQASVFVLFGVAEVFVLLLGEIDLALGFAGTIGAVFAVWITGPPHHQPWIVGVLLGLAVPTVIGIVWGLLVTRLRIPSFIVTLAGLLGLQGLLIFLINKLAGESSGGTMSVSNKVINNIAYGSVETWLAWTALAVIVVAFAAVTVWRDRQRRASGLTARPIGLSILKIGVIAVAGIVLVLVCSAGSGVPWAVPIVLAIVFMWTLLLTHTRFGRYVYAIGGNAEAARRAGINLSRIRVICFALSSLTAGAAGIFYAARLGSISSNVDGGQTVLLAVAAAVIGGTSLFGGRGKIVHALLGGLIVATIYNGMGLLNLSAATQLMVTALVLLAAVTVDAVSRRSRATA